METQKTLNSQSNLEKEKQNWWNQTPYIRLYYKVVYKTVTDRKTEIQHSKGNHKQNEKITLRMRQNISK